MGSGVGPLFKAGSSPGHLPSALGAEMGCQSSSEIYRPMWRHRASKCRNHNPLGQATVAPSQGKNRKTLGAMVLSCGETVSGKPHGVVIAILSSGDIYTICADDIVVKDAKRVRLGGIRIVNRKAFASAAPKKTRNIMAKSPARNHKLARGMSGPCGCNDHKDASKSHVEAAIQLHVAVELKPGGEPPR